MVAQEEPVQQTQPVGIDVDPDFREKVRKIFDAWHDGSLSFQKAMEQLKVFRAEAVDQQLLANEAHLENNIGIMQGYRANLDASIEHFERARDLYEQVGNRDRATACILNLGETFRLKGSFTQAQRSFHTVYQHAKAKGDIPLQTLSLTNEGQLLMSMRRPQIARQRLEEALSLSQQEWNDPRRPANAQQDNLAEVHHALATLCLEENKIDEAWTHAKAALEIGLKLDKAVRLGFANRILGDVITLLPETPAEFSSDPDVYYQKSLEHFREVKADGEAARTLYAQGKSLAYRGKKREAGRLFQQSMIVFGKLGMTDDAAKAAEAQLKLT